MEFLLLSLIGVGLTCSFVTTMTGDDPSDTDPSGDPRSGDNSSGDDPSDGNGPDDAPDGDDLLILTGSARGFGHSGNDTIDANDDALGFGGAGDDRLNLDGNAVGFGEAGNDVFAAYGRSASYGGAGNDGFDIGSDATAFGGAGNDRFEVMDHATAYGGAGDDSLRIANGSIDAEAHGDDGNDILTYVSTEYGGERASLSGDSGDDTILGGYDGVNYEPMFFPDDARFSGGTGNDLMAVAAGSKGWGGDGNDTMIGFSGSTLVGNAGNDHFVAHTFGEDRPYIYDDSTPEQFDLAYLGSEKITILDFTKGEDRLLVDLNGATPLRIDLSDNGTDTTVTAVFPNSLDADTPFTSTVLVKGVVGLSLDDLSFSNGAAITASVVNGKTVYTFTEGTPVSV